MEKFKHYSQVKDKLPVPDKLYRFEESKIESFNSKFNSLDKERYGILELFERLQFLPHESFFIELADYGFIYVELVDSVLKIMGQISYRAGSTSMTLNYLNYYSKGGKIPPKDFQSQRIDLFEGVTCNSLHMQDRKLVRISLDQSKVRHEVILAELLAALEVLYESRDEIKVAEISESVDEEEFVTQQINLVPDQEDFIVQTWADSLRYQKSSKKQRLIFKARRRLHSVPGHWRNYTNGKRVWIKSHKRGDISLGKIISAVIIK